MSTISYRNVLSEASGCPLRGFCKIYGSDTLITYDDSAMRTWTLDKHVKSLHIKRQADAKFITMYSLPSVKSFCIVFASVGQAGGWIEVWDENLTPIQRIDLSYDNLIGFSIVDDCGDLCILEKKGMLTILGSSISYNNNDLNNSTASPTNSCATCSSAA